MLSLSCYQGKKAKKGAKMLQAILTEELQKSCRNFKAGHIRIMRKSHRLARRIIRNFYVPVRDKAPGDNFPKEPMGLR